jgi:hypothetical protein
MTTIQYITIEVNNEFVTDYQRNLVKAYLLKAIARNEQRNPLSNHEIGKILGIDRNKVASHIQHMEDYNSKDIKNNQMFRETFTPKFQAVKRACENYATLQMIRFGEMANSRAVVHLRNAKMRINVNLN